MAINVNGKLRIKGVNSGGTPPTTTYFNLTLHDRGINSDIPNKFVIISKRIAPNGRFIEHTTGVTDSNGYITFENLPKNDGNINYEYQFDVYDSSDDTGDTVWSDTFNPYTIQNLSFERPLPYLLNADLTILDENENPISGVTVGLFDQIQRWGQNPAHGTFTTDENGMISVDGIEIPLTSPGLVWRLSKYGYEFPSYDQDQVLRFNLNEMEGYEYVIGVITYNFTSTYHLSEIQPLTLRTTAQPEESLSVDLGTETGYIKVNYWDGTTEVLGNGVAYNTDPRVQMGSPIIQINKTVDVNDTYSDRTIEIYSCDVDGNITGNILYIGLASTNFDSIDVLPCRSLYELHINNTQISTLNLTGLTSLFRLGCNGTPISSLDITGLDNLWGLYCNDTNLDSSDNDTLLDLLAVRYNNLSPGQMVFAPILADKVFNSNTGRTSASDTSYNTLLTYGWTINGETTTTTTTTTTEAPTTTTTTTEAPTTTTTTTVPQFITFTKANYGTDVDVVSQYLTLKRGNNQGLFNTNEGGSYSQTVWGGVRHLWMSEPMVYTPHVEGTVNIGKTYPTDLNDPSIFFIYNGIDVSAISLGSFVNGNNGFEMTIDENGDSIGTINSNPWNDQLITLPSFDINDYEIVLKVFGENGWEVYNGENTINLTYTPPQLSNYFSSLNYWQENLWSTFDPSSIDVQQLVNTIGDGGSGINWPTLQMVPWQIVHNGNPLGMLNKEMIMLDVLDGKFYKVKFTQWTSGGAGGGLSYTRQLLGTTIVSTTTTTTTEDPTTTTTTTEAPTTTTTTTVDTSLLISVNGSGYTENDYVWYDGSSYGNNGVLYNGVGYSSSDGGYLTFDGANDYVEFGNPSNLQLSNGSVSLWVKATSSNSGFKSIIAKRNSWGLFLVNNVLAAFDWGNYYATGFNINVGLRSTGVNIGDNQWHNVVLTFTNLYDNLIDNSVIYLDGTPILTTTILNYEQIYSVRLGDGGYPGQNLSGGIGQSEIYNRVLSSQEVQSNYNSQKSKYGL